MAETLSSDMRNELIPRRIDCGDCLLRPLDEGDVGLLETLFSDSDVIEFLDLAPEEAGALVEENVAGEALNMAITDARGGFAGFISARPVIDCYPSMPRWKVECAVEKGCRGKGYASAALGALTDFLMKNFALPRVEADICMTNAAAEAVARKCGFERPSGRLAYMDFSRVRQGMRYRWYRMQPGRRAQCFAKALQLYRLGNFLEAAELWHEALGHQRYHGTPYSDGMILANIGMAYSSAGWYAQARRFLHQAEVLEPGSDYIKAELRWIDSRCGVIE